MRNSVMESLGFTETPSVSYVSPSPQAATAPKATPTRLVSTATKRAITVEEIWNTTELETQSMADWGPGEVDKRHLNKRVRWPLMVMWFLIIGVIGAGGYWIYQTSINEASNAIATVRADATVLDSTFGSFLVAIDSLTPGTDEISPDLNEAISAVDAAGRELFSSSASLPTSEPAQRSAATDAATQALDAAKTLNTTTAYLGALTPLMTPPVLVTDPELIDLATAATDFGGWRSRFDAVRGTLPESILSRVSAELAVVSGQLERIQGDYLDALRQDDRIAAVDAIRELESKLAATWELVVTETDSVKASISQRIEDARKALLLLTG